MVAIQTLRPRDRASGDYGFRELDIAHREVVGLQYKSWQIEGGGCGLAILRRYHVHLAVILANAAFATIFVRVALSGFHQPAPHGVPVGIVAPAGVAREIDSNRGAHIPGGFDLRPLPSEQRARVEIEHRQLDRALLVSPRGLDLLTAEAGGTRRHRRSPTRSRPLTPTPAALD
jgi:hypothetical protein